MLGPGLGQRAEHEALAATRQGQHVLRDLTQPGTQLAGDLALDPVEALLGGLSGGLGGGVTRIAWGDSRSRSNAVGARPWRASNAATNSAAVGPIARCRDDSNLHKA